MAILFGGTSTTSSGQVNTTTAATVAPPPTNVQRVPTTIKISTWDYPNGAPAVAPPDTTYQLVEPELRGSYLGYDIYFDSATQKFRFRFVSDSPLSPPASYGTYAEAKDGVADRVAGLRNVIYVGNDTFYRYLDGKPYRVDLNFTDFEQGYWVEGFPLGYGYNSQGELVKLFSVVEAPTAAPAPTWAELVAQAEAQRQALADAEAAANKTLIGMTIPSPHATFTGATNQEYMTWVNDPRMLDAGIKVLALLSVVGGGAAVIAASPFLSALAAYVGPTAIASSATRYMVYGALGTAGGLAATAFISEWSYMEMVAKKQGNGYVAGDKILVPFKRYPTGKLFYDFSKATKVGS